MGFAADEKRSVHPVGRSRGSRAVKKYDTRPSDLCEGAALIDPFYIVLEELSSGIRVLHAGAVRTWTSVVIKDDVIVQSVDIDVQNSL